MVLGEVLKYLKGERMVIYQEQGSTAKPLSLSDNTLLTAIDAGFAAT